MEQEGWEREQPAAALCGSVLALTPLRSPRALLRSRDTENKEFVFSFLLCSSLHFQAHKAGSALLGQVRNQFLKKAEQKIAYNMVPGGRCFQKNSKNSDS